MFIAFLCFVVLATLISTPATGAPQRSLERETYRRHGVSGCGVFAQILPLARALPLIVTGALAVVSASFWKHRHDRDRAMKWLALMMWCGFALMMLLKMRPELPHLPLRLLSRPSCTHCCGNRAVLAHSAPSRTIASGSNRSQFQLDRRRVSRRVNVAASRSVELVVCDEDDLDRLGRRPILCIGLRWFMARTVAEGNSATIGRGCQTTGTP